MWVRFKGALTSCSLLAASLTGVRASYAAPIIDGTVSSGEGYTLVSTQTNVTTSQASDGGGPGGQSNEATATSTGNFTNLSNAYAQIDPVADALDLFIGGSMEEDNDSKYQIALQLNGKGVTSLAGQAINGAASSSSLDKIHVQQWVRANRTVHHIPRPANHKRHYQYVWWC